jgi:cellulose biosynthesis protein BcsQ
MIITFYNHKGGVHKTTLAHDVAFALTKQKDVKKVLLIDSDSQGNLTSSIYGLADFYNDFYSSEKSLFDFMATKEDVWSVNTKTHMTISEFLDDAINNESNHVSKPFFCHKHNENLHLMSGAINLHKIEIDLFAISQLERSSVIFGRIQNRLNQLKNIYDFIVIDTSPSSSSIINALFVMMSDAFISPSTPQFYSAQSAGVLLDIMTQWRSLLKFAEKKRGLEGVLMDPIFLGICMQKVRRYDGTSNINEVSHSHNAWLQHVNSHLMSMEKASYFKQDIFKKCFPSSAPYIVTNIFDRTEGLMYVADKASKPFYAITQDDCRMYRPLTSKGQKSTPYDITNPSRTRNGTSITNEPYHVKKKVDKELDYIAEGLVQFKNLASISKRYY